MFRTQSTDENEKTIFTYHAEKGDYRGWIAWGDKSVVLTSEELVEAGATLQNELSVPEENGEAEAYKASLKLTALKRLNAVNVSWNAFAAEDITKVIIRHTSNKSTNRFKDCWVSLWNTCLVSQ